MATITTIKQHILQLDAGSFQILCDAYLSREGYSNIMPLGTQAGTQKTTKGTPDSYFCSDDGKYIFVEYTTQQNDLIKKIEDDLNKCLDSNYTGIDVDKITTIIYCHTSSNIAPKHDLRFKDICSKSGINLIIIGIDKLSEDLLHKYPSIVKDHLHLTIDTEQIQSYDDFIEQYDSNRLAASLNTNFMYREKELEEIAVAFNDVDIVVLTGAAGTGKTRLALYYSKKHAVENKENLYCIHANGLPFYEDLKSHMEKPGDYFILVDDANQLSSNIKYIVEYVNKKAHGYNVKTIITVRDYAVDKVKSEIGVVADYKIVNINVFKDDEIKSLIEKALDINNPHYLDRIVSIAEGNARIAMIAGKIARDANRLDPIDDVSELYEEYYGKALSESGLEITKDILVALGIVSFLNTIHLDRIDALLPLMESMGISKDNFIVAIYKLHDFEIVDIYHDAVVRFSEQCFENFILKYIFCDKKTIYLSSMIEICFNPYRSRMILSLNTLINIFQNQETRAFVESEIKTVWDKKKSDSPEFMEFVKVFYRVNPTDTLLIIKKIVDSTEPVSINVCDIDTKSGKNFESVNDDIIEILAGFADTQELEMALDLFFEYYLKRPDKYMQFYHATKIYFSVHQDSYRINYSTQIKFVQKITEYSDDWNNEYIKLLFLDIAKELLCVHFSTSEGNHRNDGITVYNFSVNLSDGVAEYRKFIWEQLLVLLHDENNKVSISKILKNYGDSLEEFSYDVVKFDSAYILDILRNICSPTVLDDCKTVEHLDRVFNTAGVDTSDFSKYLNSEKMSLLKMLEGPDYRSGLEYEEREDSKRKQICDYISSSADKLVAFKDIINICEEASQIEDYNIYFINESVDIAIDKISENEEDYLNIIDFAIENNYTSYIPPRSVIDKLFSILSAEEVYKLIIRIKNEAQNNLWLYTYFEIIPESLIDEKIFKNMHSFFLSDTDRNIERSTCRDIIFVDKYRKYDYNVFCNIAKIVFDKREYSPFITHIYLQLLFNKFANNPAEIVFRFSDKMDLLEQIYIWENMYDQHCDFDGEFLLEICKASTGFLKRYVDTLLLADENKAYKDNLKKCRVLYKSDNYIEFMDTVVDSVISTAQYLYLSTHSILPELVTPEKSECEKIGFLDKALYRFEFK